MGFLNFSTTLAPTFSQYLLDGAAIKQQNKASRLAAVACRIQMINMACVYFCMHYASMHIAIRIRLLLRFFEAICLTDDDDDEPASQQPSKEYLLALQRQQVTVMAYLITLQDGMMMKGYLKKKRFLYFGLLLFLVILDDIML